MPTSVLLAVLTAAGLLALAPALVRRYDATERLVAERALSTARVLDRHRRRRTVPGRLPINPPRWLAVTAGHPGGGSGATRTGLRLLARLRALPARRRTRHRPPPGDRAMYRRRRVLAVLVGLNIVEAVGVATVGPGFWVGLGATGALLGVYLAHLRNRALRERRRRRAAAREAAWLAARQAEVREEQERRAAERRAAAKRAAARREAMRRSALGVAAPELPAAVGETVSYRPPPHRSGVRGQAYEARRAGGRLG
ncbi:hypothetical protein GCM10010124_24140 [Pilimelia terevasa]|uniref:Uncharacterized protein n=1 Tax=Pilimelia terevasa TaxID=53372 RepID=A0A8J3BMU6_9ACTN|nr:hypothetical protein GCM10010124_24140 [Pilimelia terevasa]